MNAVEFLRVIHGPEPPAFLFTGYSHRFTDGGPFQNGAYRDIRRAARRIGREQHGADVYATLATFKERHRNKRNISASKWAGLDRDALPLAAPLPPPTLTVQTSPKRFQDFWELGSLTDKATVEWLQRTIAAANGNGNEAIDPGRFWRLPGTPNHKRGGSLVEVVEYRPECVYGPLDFDHLRPLRATAVPVVAPVSTVDGLLVWQRVQPLLSPAMVALGNGEDVRKADGTAYRTPSEGDQALLTALVNAGLNDSEIQQAFLATTRGRAMIDRHGKDTLRRIVRGIEKARTFVSLHPAASNLTRAHARFDVEVLDTFGALLGPYGISIYLKLIRHDNPGHRCFVSRERIAKDLGISLRKAKNEVNRLAALGFIRIEDGPGRSDNFFITSPEEVLSSLSYGAPGAR